MAQVIRAPGTRDALPGIGLADPAAVRQCLRDVVALATLPAMWSGADPLRIAESLAASLFTAIRPQLVYVCVVAGSGRPVEVAQVGRYESSPALAARVGPHILEWSRSHDPEDVLRVEDFGVVTRCIGYLGELGAIGIAFSPDGPPGDSHQLLLNVAATQATIAIQNARLMGSVQASELAARAAEAGQRESAERLRAALAAASTGTFRWDVRTGALRWDESLDRLFGMPPGRTARTLQEFFELVHPDDRAEVAERCAQSAATGADFEMEFRVVLPDGGERWLHDKGKVVLDRASRPDYMTGACVDITSARRAQEERDALLESERAARGEAERAGRLKDEFLATLSHELRTPLSAILGWSQLLRFRQARGEDISEGLHVIERNARIQTQLIADLLDMSRIVSGKLRLELQRVDLADIARAAIESVQHAAQARDIRIETRLEPMPGVRADPARIQQVIWNLVSNAIKFTPKGGRVRLAIEDAGAHAQLSVSDDGQGIAPDFLPHLFERFRQADAATTRVHGGLGLGLALVKSIVDLHGGSVYATSAGLGHGATFVIRLPFPAADRTGERPPLGEAEAPGVYGGSGDPEPASLDGVSVLVVDDDADSRNLVRRFLEDSNALVLAAADAEEALELVRQRRPDVMLSDISMPRQDGYTLIRRLRALPAASGGATPAAALTAFARAEDRQRALLAGYQAHITKPFERERLVALVARLAAIG